MRIDPVRKSYENARNGTESVQKHFVRFLYGQKYLIFNILTPSKWHSVRKYRNFQVLDKGGVFSPLVISWD